MPSPHNQPTIRQATDEDAGALTVLAERTFRGAFGADNNPEDLELHCQTYFSPDIQLQEIRDPKQDTVVAVFNEELVAFTQVRRLSAKECVGGQHPTELHRIYVSDEWHGKGVAQQLMAEVFSIAKGVGADKLWLGVWEENPKGIAFYTKCGFKPVGSHIYQVGSDPQKDLVLSIDMVE